MASLPQHDLLLVLAEVAAAFMGFSMVVGLLRSGSPVDRARFFSVRDVAEISLLAIALSLAPLVLVHYRLGEEAIWRVVSLAATLLWLGGLTLALRRFGLSSEVAPWRQSRMLATVAPAINLAGNGLLWWNVLAPTGLAGARYVSALGLLLLLAGGMFIQATFQEPSGPTNDRS